MITKCHVIKPYVKARHDAELYDHRICQHNETLRDTCIHVATQLYMYICTLQCTFLTQALNCLSWVAILFSFLQCFETISLYDLTYREIAIVHYCHIQLYLIIFLMLLQYKKQYKGKASTKYIITNATTDIMNVPSVRTPKY